MTMDYSAEVAQKALDQFEKPDGQPLFEHASEALRLMYHLDVANYVAFCKSRSTQDLKALFSASEPDSVESLILPKGEAAPFGGEWFMKVALGRKVELKSGTNILAHGNITIEDNVILGEQAQLVTVGHPMHPKQRHLLMIGPMVLAEGSVVGGGTIALNPGTAEPVVLGRHAIALPGSIVSRSVPDYAVVGGVNKILLEGQEYFTNDVSDGSLAKRLNGKGLAALKENAKAAGLELPEDICAKPPKKLPANVRTIDHTATKEWKNLSKFFPGASDEVLRMGLFFPPVYLAGSGKITLGNNILLNTSSLLDIDGEFELGDGSFIAPEAEVKAPAGSKVVVGKKVWLGAKVKVTAKAGETLSIGDGSVLAAGAEVTQSVPAMSVVVGEGKIVNTLGDKDVYASVSPELNNFETYENQRIKLREHIAAMPLDRIKETLAEYCRRPAVSVRMQKLGKKL